VSQFTPEAAILWSSVPKDARERILKSVFCGNCCASVTMVGFTGKAEKGDLILTGKCAKCGGKVVRLLETSERDSTRN
jgi:hypothetical protein